MFLRCIQSVIDGTVPHIIVLIEDPVTRHNGELSWHGQKYHEVHTQLVAVNSQNHLIRQLLNLELCVRFSTRKRCNSFELILILNELYIISQSN